MYAESLTPDRIEMSLRQADPITSEILTRAEIRAVTARRSYARRYIGELIAQHGEEQVLLFP